MTTGGSLFAELAVRRLPTAKKATGNRARKACNYVPALKRQKKGILVSVLQLVSLTANCILLMQTTMCG